jgi:uncharacterized membrane protein HdeD (DUF308 family)/alpha-beta hydrolase superfamily lysophospholipase
MRFVLGAMCVLAGAVLLVRPFTSLRVLTVAVAVAAIATGATRWGVARRTAGWWDDVTAAGWIVLGVLVAAWPSLSVRGVAVAVGVGMIVGGLADAAGVRRGSLDERAASLMKGAASVILGVLALAWPDVTVLVVAVVFGARTVLFGLAELVGALRRAEAPARAAGERRGFGRRSLHLAGTAAGLLFALVLGGVSVGLHKAEPAVDAFYDTPDDVPDDPGMLVRSESFHRTIPDGASAWRILYTTTRADGVPAMASALVIAPDSPSAEPRPVIAWAHGTTGVNRRCAPSVLADPLGSGAFYALDEVLEQGWVLVATDYPGLGTEGVHPYLVGDAEARSVLDAVRAAHRMPELDLADQTVVWGHSQGGGAALWTGQIAPVYAPDAHVIGVAALAPAADTVNLADNLARIPGGSIFASYVLTGYAGMYPDVRAADYVRPAARSVVDGLARRCLSEPAVLVSVLTSITTSFSVFQGDLRRGPLADRLAANVPSGPFQMPLLVGQGAADPLVLPEVQAAFVRGLCAAGVRVDYRTYAGRDHVGVVAADSPLIPDLVAWTHDRLAGTAPPTNC